LSVSLPVTASTDGVGVGSSVTNAGKAVGIAATGVHVTGAAVSSTVSNTTTSKAQHTRSSSSSRTTHDEPLLKLHTHTEAVSIAL
jgi:hypothetical protein